MKVRVLFVCMGNICRSPAAQGVFERLVAAQGLERVIAVDSAGTHAYHVGEEPDARMQAAARRRGLDLSPQRARRVEVKDYSRFDYIIAMDRTNLMFLEDSRPTGGAAPTLFMTYADSADGDEVPDPYYGGGTGFERVLDLVEDASAGLLRAIRERNGL